MQHQSARNQTTVMSAKRGPQVNSLRSRSDDVLIAVAVLGLVATIVDGEANLREIDSFTLEFKKRFALSRRQSLKLIALALKRVRAMDDGNVIDCACDTLNEYLDTSQKLALFEALSDVLVADGRIHDGEAYYLDYIAGKLNLLKTLEERYPLA